MFVRSRTLEELVAQCIGTFMYLVAPEIPVTLCNEGIALLLLIEMSCSQGDGDTAVSGNVPFIWEHVRVEGKND